MTSRLLRAPISAAISCAAISCAAISCAALAFAAAPAAAAPLTVTGRATAEDPSAAVTVELLPLATRYTASAARLAGDDAPAPVTSARPRADGTYTLTAPGPGMWTLRAAAAGHVSRTFALQPLVADQTVPPVVLPAASGRELRVADAAGRPLAGVLLTAWSASTAAFGDDDAWHAALVHRRSDADGRVALPPLAGDARLLVERPGFLDLDLDLDLDRGEADDVATAAVRLAPGTARALRVVGPTGRPEPDVLVFLGRSWLPSGTSDADGRVSVAAPAEASELILLAADGRRVTTELEPATPEDGDAVVELRLPAAETIAGQVVEAESREPLADAFVWSPDEPAAATTSGPRGDFRVPAPPGDGRRALRAAAAGHFPTQVRLEPAGTRELGAVTVALAPAAAVAGRVVDPEGRPVTGAEVRVAIDPGGGWAGARHGPAVTTSGARGLFHVPHLTPSGAYVLTASHAGFGAARARVVAGDGDDVELRLGPSRRATGRLLDLDERPIAGGEVRLVAQSPDRRDPFLDDADAGSHVARSDAEGRFAVDDLTAGAYDLAARAPGYAPLEVPGVTVEEAPTTELGDLLLVAGADVVGRVVDPAGMPVADAAVYLPGRAGLPLRYLHRFARPETRSAADGTFRLVDRQPGETLDLAVYREGYALATAPAVVAGEAEPLEVVLRPVGTVRGRVVDERGRAVAGASVMTRPSAQVIAMDGDPVETGDDGRFTLADVEPGAAMIEATARGFQAATLDPVEVPAGGEVSDLELVLEPGATVEGVVRTAGGEPVSGARVMREEPTQTTFRGPRRYRYLGSESAADGTFSLDGLAPGAHTLTARHPRLGEAVRHVELAVGSNRVDLVLASGHEISGRVVDADGAPVAGAALEVTAIADRTFRSSHDQVARSDADGAFRLVGLADGRYLLSATAAGRGRSPALDVEVAGSDVGGLRLELAPQATIRGRILGLELTELAEMRLYAHDTGRAGAVLLGVVDHQGEFQIDGAAAGSWVVQATTRDGRSGTARVEVPPGAAEATVDLDFAGGLTLSGRVLRDGAPVGGVNVMALGTETGKNGHGTTDRDGRFRIAGLAAGTTSIHAVEPNGGWTHAETVELAGDLEHDLVLETATVSGQVLAAATGEPIARARVSLAPPAGDAPALAMASADSAETDSRGRFRVTSFVAGAHRLTVTAEGYALQELVLDLGPGGGHEGLVVTLDPGIGLDLQVVARGLPPPGQVTVGVLDAGGRIVTSGAHTLDAAGTTRLGALPAGTWTLVVGAEGAAPATVPVEVPGPPATVVLEPAAQLVVVVPDLATGQNIAFLILENADGNVAPHLAARLGHAHPVIAGRATVDSLPAGTWTATARTPPPDERSWTATVTLTAGERREVVLE